MFPKIREVLGDLVRIGGFGKRLSGRPAGVGRAGELGVVIARVVGDFLASPFREGNRLIFAFEFDFRDAETFIFAVENIDLPLHAVVHDDVAGLIDEGGLAEGEHPLGVGDGDGVLHFQAGDAVATTFDRERGIVPGKADAHAFLGVRAQISLRQALGFADDLATPGFADQKEFAFYFERFTGFLGHRFRLFRRKGYVTAGSAF